MQKMLLSFLVLLLTTAQAATITVGPDGCDHKRIQAAIDAASSGDLIGVAEGTYYENIDLDKPLTLRGTDEGERLAVLDAGGEGTAITISADGAIVADLIVTNSSYSGMLVRSDDNMIVGVSAIDNEYCGIRLDGSRNNTVENSNFSQNGVVGIKLEVSEYNRILSNTICRNGDSGIDMAVSSNNLIAHNSVSENGNDGIELKGSNNNHILSNHAIDNLDGICLELTSDGNHISGNNASYNELSGIMLRDSRDNTIEKNEAKKNNQGICLMGSSNTTVRGNNASENYLHGIHLSYYSWENIIYSNQFIGNVEYEAYDESGRNQWDDGEMGNLYGDFDEPSEGCIASNGICNAVYVISGGSSVDRYPLAALA